MENCPRAKFLQQCYTLSPDCGLSRQDPDEQDLSCLCCYGVVHVVAQVNRLVWIAARQDLQQAFRIGLGPLNILDGDNGAKEFPHAAPIERVVDFPVDAPGEKSKLRSGCEALEA